MMGTLWNVRSMARTVAILGVLATATVACGDDSGDGAAPAVGDLAGRTFLSSSVSGQTLIPDTRVTVAFSDDDLVSVAGCNTQVGGFSLDGSTLMVDPLASTMMACDGEAEAQDRWLGELLQSSPTVTLDGDQLTIVGSASSGDVELTLVDRSTIGPADQLAGGTWTIRSLELSSGTLTAPDGAHLAVDADRLYVATGCNRGSSSWSVTDGTVTVGPMAMTMQACESPLADWELALNQFLLEPFTFAIDGEALTLTNASGTLLADFVP
jgi:heat shock protein HslJ